MLCKLTLGDWSNDGHGRYDEFYIESNYPVSVLRQAYKDSCKIMGITFNCNEDYTGMGLDYNSPRRIWVNYEDFFISERAFRILLDHRCFEGVAYVYDTERNKAYVEDNEESAKLIMNFIKYSMPEDFHYEILTIDAEPINGWWNSELNVHFGYGLYD